MPRRGEQRVDHVEERSDHARRATIDEARDVRVRRAVGIREGHDAKSRIGHEVKSPGLAIIRALGLAYAPVYGPESALFCELFDTRVRYTGISTVYQVSGIVSSSITPLIATSLLKAYGGEPRYIALYIFAVGMVSAISTYYMRRTF